MGTTDYSVWIEASPEDIWGIYVDPMRIPEWQTGSPVIEHVHGSGDQVGTTYVSRRRPGAARTTVTEVDKPRRLVTTTEAYWGCDSTSRPRSRLSRMALYWSCAPRRTGHEDSA